MAMNNILVAIFVVFLFALYLSNVAGRLDRLHLKVENARHALDRQLALRSAICSDLSGIEIFDVALRQKLSNAIQTSIKEESLLIHTRDEWAIESAVSKVLGEIFHESFDVKKHQEFEFLIKEVAGAARRVQYALTIFNDAVKSVHKVRKRWLVKGFRLYGRAKMPHVIEFDTAIPVALLHY
jgi:hypothetical protein